MRKIKLTLCYDGAGYHGWQRQPGRPSALKLKLRDKQACISWHCLAKEKGSGSLGEIGGRFS